MNTNNTTANGTVFSQASDALKKKPQVSPGQSGSSSFAAEKEVGKQINGEFLQTVSTEIEMPKEVEQTGVTMLHDTIELPPDVKKLGVSAAGSAMPVAATTTLPPVVLPISDDQVVAGLHQQVTNALRWLSEWCIMRLKKAHVALKIVHGNITRIKI